MKKKGIFLISCLFVILVIGLVPTLVKGEEFNSAVAPEDYIPEELTEPVIMGTEKLIVQDIIPWGFSGKHTPDKVLIERGESFNKIRTSDLAAHDLSEYRVIIISSDQRYSSYENLISNKLKLENFVSSGGVLVAHACDRGYGGGHWASSYLPGGVYHGHIYTNFVQIAMPSHPIVNTPHLITNDEVQGWDWSTHGYFTNLVPDTNVIIKEGLERPTYIEYQWGAGLVIANMMPMEWQYSEYDLTRNEIDYAQSYRPRTIEKELSAVEGELGDVVHVSLSVTVPFEETVTVVDTFPEGFGYIKGSFMIDGVPAIPSVEKGVLTYEIIDSGSYVLEFDVKIDEAKNWEDMEVCNIVSATWYSNGEIVDEMEDEECFVIHPFEDLQKYVGLPKADIIFAIDLTGSMGGEIAVVKTEAISIMDSLAARIADVQFGLVSFMDYVGTYSTTEPGSVPETYTARYGYSPSGDYPYLLDQGLTTDTTDMANDINALTLGSGADGPQDYTRIIHESWNDDDIDWRDDAEKFLILFGDNVPHDTNFDFNNDGTPDNRGGDPGRDTLLGNGDDLDFETEVDNADANGIHIMAVYSGSTGSRYPWEYMATETGGGYYKLEDAEDIPDAIIEFIEGEISETLTIEEATETQWALVMEVTNPFSYTMTNTRITDRFGSEIEIDDPFPYSSSQGLVIYGTKGKSEKVFLTWEIGDLCSGETARLIILVSTDLNPAGQQEYSSPGFYELNSGATLKFIDPEQDMQLSAYTDSIFVTVLPT